VKGWSIRKKLILFFLFATVIPFLISRFLRINTQKKRLRTDLFLPTIKLLKTEAMI